MSVAFSTSPPLRQGFLCASSAPQSSDFMKVGSAGRSSLLGQQLRSKPAFALGNSPVTPLGRWSEDDASPLSSTFNGSRKTGHRNTRSFESIVTSSVDVDSRTRAVRGPARSKGEPVPVSVGFRVNRKSVGSYPPPAAGQTTYKNDAKPLGLLQLQLSKRREAGEQADSTTKSPPRTPPSPIVTKVPATSTPHYTISFTF
eukprot:1191032-Prorocentrum_minimum.AAC.8